VDTTTELVNSLLYDPLYRLDETLQPQPVLAAQLPKVSQDGLTWTIPLANAQFGDGAPVTAGDVAYSLSLAASPNCPYGPDLCQVVSDNLASANSRSGHVLSLTLNAPFGPFLTEVLARVPVLEEAAVQKQTRKIISGARGIDPEAPRQQVDAITSATNQDTCLADTPPFGCKYSDYTQTLEQLLTNANVSLPPKARFITPTGDLDPEAYAGALLDRVASLDQVLTGAGLYDVPAAALPLIDPLKNSLGSGPYVLDDYKPGESLTFVANPGRAGGPPKIPTVTLEIIRDPSAAATALLTGEADWDLEVDPSTVPQFLTSQGVSLGTRPLQRQMAIVFNVRPGHVYSDPIAREAFATCLDVKQAANAGGVTGNLALTRTSANSWAMPVPADTGTHDIAKATSLLEGDGWTKGADGIYAKNGQRLSSSIAVRPSRADLVQFASSAAQQLSDCGIELDVQQLDLTGDLEITQLQWPNDYDTILISRHLATDPDGDMQAFETSHATSADNPADANSGGYSSPTADSLIEQARGLVDLTARAPLYAQLAATLATDVPDIPIWYDGATSAISQRVKSPQGAVNPAEPRFWWDLANWTLSAH
jgi:ABC-type transport system substrate-binding protein